MCFESLEPFKAGKDKASKWVQTTKGSGHGHFNKIDKSSH